MESDWLDLSNDNETDYDGISEAEAIAFAAGDYTPNGWLRNKNLRILPLGDSITYGYASSDGNGYRNALREVLTKANNTVDMIGSVKSGSMEDNDNEGHSGFLISQIANITDPYRQRPNVVLLHAGTNDMNKPSDPDTAPQRLDDLVGALVAALPDATIIVARIIPAADSNTESRIRVFNNEITKLMADRARDGEQVIIVDMPSGVQTSDLKDGLHPNDKGYENMAIKWAISLTAADSLSWIHDPVAGENSSLPSREFCSHDPVWVPQDEIASGAGLGPNLWLHSKCFKNLVSGACYCGKLTSPMPLTQELLDTTDPCEQQTLSQPMDTALHFADLNGDGRADFLWVDEKGAVTAYLNAGSSEKGENAAKVGWLPQGVIATGVGGDRGSVQFADLNGDGRAEYLWVHEDGSVDCWLNLGGPDNGPNAGKVKWLPQGTIATGIGRDGDGVRFADLNGDGRAEYLYVNANGSVEVYLNLGPPDQGPNAGKVGWLAQGTIAAGAGMARENVIFADVNGDGRADYVAMSRKNGSAQLWVNGGGPDNGTNAAKVVWEPHGTIASGVGTSGMGAQMADLNGDGRAEYLDVKFNTSAVDAWLNAC